MTVRPREVTVRFRFPPSDKELLVRWLSNNLPEGWEWDVISIRE